MSQSSTERCMYNGLLKGFSSKQFLLDLPIMYDILAELAILSENLQKRNASIVYASASLNLSKRSLWHSNFRGLNCDQEWTQQLLSSVANNLKKRLFTTISTHGLTSASSETDIKSVQYEMLLNQIKVLDCDQWPADLPAGYGDEEIQNLCTRFQLNASKMRDYLDNSHCIP
ncbi:hypothetical protein PR048_020607 [Dryococelus australis]|uniref:Uncharacterized protein n=1 Tax=Dryococelus australis TaxID=614101 RepID=A0ABQ9H6U1_9NEOP|nr:hypothetical protein PR048_020607 [Dryococelus australis]